jgi:hypothetical protein
MLIILVFSYIKLRLLNTQGSLNHKLELNEPQGNVVGLDVSEDFLVVVREDLV